MARVVILGGGVSGQTAALYAKTKLGGSHEVVVITPNSLWNWIPSNIWVGVGLMKPEQVTFPLAPVYKKTGITAYQAKAISIHPEGDATHEHPFVTVEYTSPDKKGQRDIVTYDYLINATGPKLNFAATPGLGPDHHSHSVCTYQHAAQTSQALDELVERMKRGEQKTLVIGTGHGTCTCQGAAFEYLFNVEYELRRRKVRDKANLVWITNEQELGDFGIGGMHIKRGGYVTHSRVFTESLFTERGVRWITRAHVREVDKREIAYETLAGEERTIQSDFSMLLPPFAGVGLTAVAKDGTDITGTLFARSGFMLVDGAYESKAYEQWSPDDWPKTYQNPTYKNIFAVGIAFAPPHAISKPMVSPRGIAIFPSPPRTGMPSGVMARQVALNIVDMISGKASVPVRQASLAKMGAACIASTGSSLLRGSAVSMTMYPIVPDFQRFPDTGRDLRYTSGEIGLAGHWVKRLLHTAFIYKAKANPLWRIVPE